MNHQIISRPILYLLLVLGTMTTSVTTQAQTWKEYYNRAYFKNALQSLKKEKSQLKIIEKNYWIGQCYDKLGYRDSSLVAYNTIEPNDDLYWSAQARIAIIYSFKGQLTSADSLLKRIEQVPARTQQSDYLQARWFYHYQRSEYDKLLEYAFRNVKHCEQNKDMSWLANAHIDLGSSYIYNSNTYKALELLKKAVAIQQKAQIQTHLDRAYQSMAIAYQSKKDFTSSDFYLKKCVAFNQARGNDFKLSYSLKGLATNALTEGRLKDAERYAEQVKAIAIAKQNIDPKEFAYTCLLSVGIKLPQKKYAEYLSLCQIALSIYQKSHNLRGQEWCLGMMGDIYEATGDLKKAIAINKLASEAGLSLKSEEKIRVAQELTTKYETEKQDKEIAKQKINILEEEQMKTYIVTASLLSVLLLVGLFVFYHWQQKQKIAKMQSQFKHTTEQLESFNYMVSHELKLPIVNMRNAVKRLKTKDADVVEVSKLEAHLNNMDGLIEAMLLLSRIEREKLNYGEVNTQTLVEDILSEVDLPAATTVAYNNLPTIRADVYLLRQLFVNLIQNAIKFSGKQPEPAIEISAELTTNKYIFSIKDNGVGFDSGKTGHLFGLFHRLHFASDFVGFGVGLVIAKTIVERHGGRIWGNGELNKGAVFHFEIPKQ